ncbi:hypothetical protein NECAME_05848 [Necator americanus]|uniref:Uncharacterized protein n=1 Tax=Necator americanus TaxID=51031 RepID=W2TXS8_NECAM|nr:hypothetical protein NECAME_05848 [Necator americanus]ETN86673.1 hypothetical protein NECAME_05848 [Necator americanus]
MNVGVGGVGEKNSFNVGAMCSVVQNNNPTNMSSSRVFPSPPPARHLSSSAPSARPADSTPTAVEECLSANGGEDG